jgi:hypothetical protein
MAMEKRKIKSREIAGFVYKSPERARASAKK